MAEGRLSRWSRVKKARAQGENLAREEAAVAAVVAPQATDVTPEDAPRVITRGGAIPVAGRILRPYMAPLADADTPRPENAVDLVTFDAERAEEETAEETRELTPEELDAIKDLPPIETLNRDSDFSGFMNEKVPAYLQRKALRTLFLNDPFYNAVDGLNDYDEDFTILSEVAKVATDWKTGRGFQSDKDLGIEEDEDSQTASVETDEGAPDVAPAEAASSNDENRDVRGPDYIAKGDGATKPSMREIQPEAAAIATMDDDDHDVGDGEDDFG